jgi:membrane-bound serine protease (ClpP class)
LSAFVLTRAVKSFRTKTLAYLWILLAVVAPATANTIYWIQVDGPIHPASARFIERAIARANSDRVEALLIELDTPGGLMDSMRDIVKAFFNSDVPIIVYVAPSGSRAASAGAFITLAADVAAMAPGTNIGAAHPVSIGSGEAMDSSGVMSGKVVNDAVAFIRSIAEKRGRNADWAEAAVRESSSLTDSEALEKNVIDLIAATRDSLLERVDGRIVQPLSGKRALATKNAELERIEKTWRDELLDIISDPNIAYVLMLLGIYGLFFELYNPGAIVPGVIGGICLILAFFAFQTLPVNIAGLLLIALAVILFLLEIKVVSYGILSIGGTISLLLGSVMLIESPIPGLRVSWSVILPSVIATLLFFGIVIGLSIKAQRRKPVTGIEGMIGEAGSVIEEINPIGKITIRGEIWKARSKSGAVPVGSRVQVVAVENMMLIVVPAPET